MALIARPTKTGEKEATQKKKAHPRNETRLDLKRKEEET